jgi:hypothetical protein
VSLACRAIRKTAGFRGIAVRFERELARHQIEGIDPYPQLEGVVALDDRRDLVAQKVCDCLD